MYENLMSNISVERLFIKNIDSKLISYTPKDSTEENWGRYML